jgi:hypothetical protein
MRDRGVTGVANLRFPPEMRLKLHGGLVKVEPSLLRLKVVHFEYPTEEQTLNIQ